MATPRCCRYWDCQLTLLDNYYNHAPLSKGNCLETIRKMDILSKGLVLLKRTKWEILELKYKITEIKKKLIREVQKQTEHLKEKVSTLEDRSMKSIQSKKKGKD